MRGLEIFADIDCALLIPCTCIRTIAGTLQDRRVTAHRARTIHTHVYVTFTEDLEIPTLPSD